MTPSSKRLQECPLRRERGCGDIDHRLGWMHAMSLPECDKCYAKGQYSPEAVAYRAEYVNLVVSAVKSKPDRMHPKVLEAILARHATPEEAVGLALAVDAAKSQAAKPKLERWLWRDWEGVAWPKRPPLAIWAFVVALVVLPPKAARAKWKAMKATGCGCDHKLKQRFKKGQDGKGTDVPAAV